MATAQGDIMVGSVKNMVDRLSKDLSANKPPMSIHEPRKNIFKPTTPHVVVTTFTYKATQPDELNLAVGDLIEVLEEIEDGWSRGKISKSGEIGMFPTNFVEAKTTPTSSALPVMRSNFDGHSEPEASKRAPSVVGIPLPAMTITTTAAPKVKETIKVDEPKKSNLEENKIKEMARVKFVYEPQHPDELKLGEIGSLIEIVRKDCGDPGWFEGELNGKVGLFPDNFVELVQVPIGTTSGNPKTTNRIEKIGVKPPILAPPGSVAIPPAVPAKPKPKLTDSNSSLNSIPPTTTSSTKPQPSSNFSDIRNRLQQGLNMFSPGDPAPLSKSTIIPGSGGENDFTCNRPVSTYEVSSESQDQSTQLNHITKNRPRGPGKRPASMMVLKKNGSTENLLESTTNISILEPDKPTVPEISQSSPSRVTAMKPSKDDLKDDKPFDYKPFSMSQPKDEPVKVRGQPYQISTTAPAKVSPAFVGESDTVSRKEYNDLLARFSGKSPQLYFLACCSRSPTCNVGNVDEIMDEMLALE